MSSGTSTQSAAGRGAVKPAASIFAVGLMLFSMFFGAGNLIFPPMLGIESGENFTPAIIGFILTGVLLATITIIAVAISGAGVRQVASRAGAALGLVVSIAAHPYIGAFYGSARRAAA